MEMAMAARITTAPTTVPTNKPGPAPLDPGFTLVLEADVDVGDKVGFEVEVITDGFEAAAFETRGVAGVDVVVVCGDLVQTPSSTRRGVEEGGAVGEYWGRGERWETGRGGAVPR